MDINEFLLDKITYIFLECPIFNNINKKILSNYILSNIITGSTDQFMLFKINLLLKITPMKTLTFSKIKEFKFVPIYSRIALIIIGFGGFLRIHQYLYNRSLWLDEAMLAVNIVDRSFSELLEPLAYRQNAPIGFLIIEKLSVTLFGPNELALRLPPLIFGIISLILFYEVAKLSLKPSFMLLALVIFAISNPLIYYSSEIKQYSADVVAALIIYLGIYQIKTENISWLKSIILGILSGLILWFSYPSIFILATGAIYLTYFYLTQKSRYDCFKLLLIYSIFILSFAILYYYFLNRSVGELNNSWDWKGFFAPLPFFSPISEILRWYLKSFNNIFISPGGLTNSGLAGMLFLTGCYALFLANKSRLFIFLLPILLTLVASSLQKYPFSTNTDFIPGGRFILFLTPILFILIAKGVEYFQKRNHKIIVAFMVIILLLSPLITTLNYIKKPRVVEEIRPIVEYVLNNYKDDDIIYLYYRSKHQFEYYQKILKTPKINSIIRGKQLKPEQYLKDIANLQGKSRVWFVFSYQSDKHKNDKNFLVNQLNLKSKKIDFLESHGSSAYLYDLRAVGDIKY